MGQVKDIACSVWRRLKGAAASLCSAVTGPARGAHSAHGDLSAPDPAPAPTPAPRARCARPARARSSRGAHTASPRRPRAIAARGAHSAPRTPRPSVPVNLNTAPAAARGYSMAEVLATVAIILILGSLVVMNVVSFQANLRQKALDAKAEIIYTAAQEQMTRIMASGREDILAAPNKNNLPQGTPYIKPGLGEICSYVTTYGVSFIPAENALPGDHSEDSPIAEWQTCYISSADLAATGSAANLLFGSGGLDEDLRSKHWVIEYDCKSLTVHAVYYSEDFDCAAVADESNAKDLGSYSSESFKFYNYELRNHAQRLKSESLIGHGRHVGYHGGGSSSTSPAYSLDPSVQVTNGEKLVATIKCAKPAGVSQDLAFLVTLQDSYGNTHRAYYTTDTDYVHFDASGSIPVYGQQVNNPALNAQLIYNGGLNYTLELTLDSLEEAVDKTDSSIKDAKRFTRLYGAKSPAATSVGTPSNDNKPLVEGSNISIKVRVLCKQNPLVETGYAGYTQWDRTTFNSLFDDANNVANPSTQVPTVDGLNSQPGIAGISCGRHLQNLDASSGVNDSYWRNGTSGRSIPYFTKAYQDADVDFAKPAGEGSVYTSWVASYGADASAGGTAQASYFNGVDASGTPCFKPISNPLLKSYSGKPLYVAVGTSASTIASLSINESSNTASNNAALFANTNGSAAESITLSDILLTDPKIVDMDSASNVGGLVAENSGTLTIENCQLYLDPFGDLPKPKDDPDPWLRGDTVGGLVGVNSTGSKLTITNSSASTVARGTTTGGLVGDNTNSGSASLKIQTSYADCYLKGTQVGGLVGSGGATVSASYTAGYLGATAENASAAGMVNSADAAISNSYTICTTYGDHKGTLTYCWISKSADSTKLSNNYYLQTKTGAQVEDDTTNTLFTDTGVASDISAEDLTKKLVASTFTLNQQSSSAPYNLMDQGLVSYNWPSIAGTYHYGDWAAGFLQGSLVYFEKYRIVNENGKGAEYCYGFTGANVKSTLVDGAKLASGQFLWKYTKNGENTTWEKIENGTSGSKNIIVVGDGYGVVYKDGTPEPNTPVVVKMPDGDDPGQWEPVASSTIGSADPYLVKPPSENSEDVYKLYPLDKDSITNTNAVNATSFCLSVTIGGDSYFFNPHFAKTVHKAGAGEVPTKPTKTNHSYSHISLRTGRHLNNLSLYYEKSGTNFTAPGYRSVTENCTFTQERNIAFTDYDWIEFANVDAKKLEIVKLGNNTKKQVLSWQEPIGKTLGGSFIATFDGGRNMITDVSFKTAGNYAGLFGYVGSKAKIEDVVLCTDYRPISTKGDSETGEEALASLKINYYIQRTVDSANRSEKVHMGVLAGYNAGTVTNCATAGYFLAGSDGTVHAYTGSTISLGGLVGTNTGAIRDCSADSPKLRLSLYQTSARVGGFVGRNEGVIKNSYALGAIDVVEAQESEASVAGFAGQNTGQVSSCYCATAIASSGADTVVNGFAPAGGRVSSCQYLNGGTYSYVTRMYAFNFDTSSSSAGEPTRYEVLKVKKPDDKGYVSSKHSYVCSQTKTTDGRYPFKGVVIDADDNLVHYGNWQDDVVLGNLGVFYWELEEGSANSGYHMTFLGSKESTEGTKRTLEFEGGTSLCNSHDDDGVITQYGYGVYVQTGELGKVTMRWDKIACGSSNALGEGETALPLQGLNINTRCYNTAASESLKTQMENTDTGDAQYHFFAFTTRVSDTNNSYEDYLYLDGNSGNVQNGSVTLTYTGDTAKTEYEYEISPFFANALKLKSVESKDGEGNPDPSITMPNSLTIKSADDNVIDCLTEPGFTSDSTRKDSESNHYEVRSLQQLQYINWNAAEKITSKLVDKDKNKPADTRHQDFPYLQYATGDPTGGVGNPIIDKLQYRKDAEAARAARAWLQTHDVNSFKGWNSTTGDKFSPIGGAATSSAAGSYNAILFAWFGGSFDGQSYTIRNISVNTKSFYVGVFGATVGATIKNIILRGDDGQASIVRETLSNDKEGAYSIGGLVGLALNYNAPVGQGTIPTEKDKTISNCAVSGYDVIDLSRNKQGKGEVCIGGLIGVANVNLKNCSAVTSIVVDPDYGGKAAGAGNYIRVGGLVGGLLDTVENCYTGGTISVGDKVLRETYKKVDNNAVMVSPEKGEELWWERSTRVFLAGIAGSAFTSEIQNFNMKIDNSKNDQNQMKVYNSYTYMQFPKMQGTICSISMIASLADRHSFGQRPIIDNCYYLESSAKLEYELPKYYYHQKSLEELLNENDTKTGMINGNVGYLAYYLGDSGKTSESKVVGPPDGTPTPLAYEDMLCFDTEGNTVSSFIDDLNNNTSNETKRTSVWGSVTIKDKNGIAIDGKYSFPSKAHLKGLNYPFPTVVTQDDLTFDVPVHVHYGDWPLNGSYWASGRGSMDIFTDMEQTGKAGRDKGWAYQSFVLYVDTNKHAGPVFAGNFSFSDPTYAEVVSWKDLGAVDDHFQKYEVAFKAKKDGFVTVYFDKGQRYGASFMLHITANWDLSAKAVVDDTHTVFDTATNTLKLRKSGVGRLQLGGSDLTGANELSGDIKWNSSPLEADVDDCLVYYNGDGNGDVLTVTRLDRDDTVVLTATAHYTYKSGQIYERKLFITVKMPSAVGISNNVPNTEEFTHEYEKVMIGGDVSEGGPLDSGETKPVPIYGSPVNFFLYTEASDSYLANPANIESVSVGASTFTPGEYHDGDAYYVEFDNSTIRTDSGHRCLGGSLYYVREANEPTAPVRITVTLQGGYKLRTTIPANSVTPAKLFFLTLDMGGAGTDLFVFKEPGVTRVPDYDKGKYNSKSGWTLEGWYTDKDPNSTKVLDSDGRVVCSKLEGVINSYAFVESGEVPLYARWTRETTAWKRVTNLNEVEKSNEFIIVCPPSTGNSTASVFYQASTVDNTSHNRGTYLSEDYVSITPDGLIKGEFANSYRWECGTDYIVPATGKKADRYLVNVDTGFFLGDNGDNNDSWDVTAVEEGCLLDRFADQNKPDDNTKHQRINIKLDSGSGGGLKLESLAVKYKRDYAPLLSNNGSWTYLYEKQDDAVESSFYYRNVLNLMNGTDCTAVEDQTAITEVAAKTTLPSSGGWQLLGWFDSKTAGGRMVIDSSGNFIQNSSYVKNNNLSLADNVTLYAKWRKATDVFVKTDNLVFDGSQQYAIVDGINILRRNGNVDLKRDTAKIRARNYMRDDGSYVDAFSASPTQWSLEALDENSSAFTISTVDAKKIYYLTSTPFVETIKNLGTFDAVLLKQSETEKLSWTLEESTTDSTKRLKLNGSATEDSRYGTFTVRPYNIQEKEREYIKDGKWFVVSADYANPISFYKKENVYEVSWEKK